MSRSKLIIIFLIILLLVILIMQNLGDITFKLFWWNIPMRIYAIPIIAVVSLILGYILGKFFGSSKKVKKEPDELK